MRPAVEPCPPIEVLADAGDKPFDPPQRLVDHRRGRLRVRIGCRKDRAGCEDGQHATGTGLPRRGIPDDDRWLIEVADESGPRGKFRSRAVEPDEELRVLSHARELADRTTPSLRQVSALEIDLPQRRERDREHGCLSTYLSGVFEPADDAVLIGVKRCER
jgi:hypothetical protein